MDSEILHSEIETTLGRERLGIERDTLTHSRLFTGKGLRNLLAAWEDEWGKPLPADLEEEMARRKSEAFTTRLKAVPFVTEALQALADFPRCVASGTPLPTLELSLKSTGLYRYFAPNLFSSTLVQRGKPAPDIFLYAAERMGVHPADCVVIEDSEHGVRAAVSAQMRVIGFIGGSHCDAHHVDGLTGANCIIRDMRNLPAILEQL